MRGDLSQGNIHWRLTKGGNISSRLNGINIAYISVELIVIL